MKNFIIANWKMNPRTSKEATALFDSISKGVKNSKSTQAVICPPFIWLSKFKSSPALKLGGQDCHWESSGAYTGEVSAGMLADAGVEYVILGHSERRQFMGESDEIINLKIKAALKVKLRPILCVGEKESEEMNLAVERQLAKDLSGLNFNQMKEVIIAYEPVWSIGTGRACLPDNALSAALFIRRILTQSYSRFLAEKTPILYGGSVDAKNALGYIKQANMNGLLIGGSSLDAAEFVSIFKEIAQ